MIEYIKDDVPLVNTKRSDEKEEKGINIVMKDEKEKQKMSCIDCRIGNCNKMEKEYPDFCLTKCMDTEQLEEVMNLYKRENKRVAVAAAEVEAEYYCKLTRIEEIAKFAEKMNYKKLGIATCVGLLKEAGIAAKILRSKGFEVYGIACKVGIQKKVEIGIDKACEKVGCNMCNPILQAQLLNHEKTGFNIIIGLCVGHDSLFTKHSEALVTTLIAKDRVLGHNPAAALYLSDTYYSRVYEE